MKNRQPIGILGATGMVGQRYIQLLENHPWFEVTWLAASDRSSGKTYGEAAKWRLDTPLPERIAKMTVAPADPRGCSEDHLRLNRCGLCPRNGATVRRRRLRRAHKLERLPHDAERATGHPRSESRPPQSNRGAALTSGVRRFHRHRPNCSTIGLVMALKPIEERFGIEQVFVTTMQAVSGAGYPGVASMDILDNVVPYIGGEEEKMEAETLKLLGKFDGHAIMPLAAGMTAHCNRVPVVDGHIECVSIKLCTKATHEEILAAWNEFRPLAGRDLPTAPAAPVQWASQPDRPQPRLDRNRGTACPSRLAVSVPATCSTGSSFCSRTILYAVQPEPPSSMPSCSRVWANLTGCCSGCARLKAHGESRALKWHGRSTLWVGLPSAVDKGHWTLVLQGRFWTFSTFTTGC